MSFDHKNYESKIFSNWKENKFYKERNLGNESFTMILPPPNVTGKLHLGHAWDAYYPDLLIRYKQLNGYDAIWYPGMDHAGIATQAKVEQKLYKEDGLTRFDLGREEFIKKIWDWKEIFSDNIQSQWDKLGLALDYDKQKFTLDSDVNELVNDSFIELYNEGLIYKKEKLINWDVVLKTAISNIEVITVEKNIQFYDIEYKIKDSDETIIVSTTRPETIFGDQAIFVNTKTEIYASLIGKTVINPANGEELPILADDYVDEELGTGAMKCTPAHDFNDNLLAEKHNLKLVTVINKDGTMNELAGKYKNLERFEAREQLVKDFKAEGIIVAINSKKSSVPTSERTGTVIEPLLSEQWFLKASELALKSFKNQQSDSKIDFYPGRFEKTFLSWVEKMEDWNISRQLWWGHQIPAWYKGEELKVQLESPGEGWVRDEDVLDTWYSSALWPIAFLDEEVRERSDNPTYLSDTLFTGYDIILFWVSRMIFQSLQLRNQPPFKNVILHGLIRDENGMKMSKSLGNGVDPLEVIEEHGSDALRIFLLGSSTPGQDIKYKKEKVEEAWRLQNKLFNTSIFIDKLKETAVDTGVDYTEFNSFFNEKLNELINTITSNVETYNLAPIYAKIREFIFIDFANGYLEVIKKVNDKSMIDNASNIFEALLIVLHPFMPFVTEYLWMQKNDDSILEHQYPKVMDFNLDLKKVNYINLLIQTAKNASREKTYNNQTIEIELSEEHSKDEELFNNFLNPYNAIVKTNRFETANGVEIQPGVGISFYKFDENTKPIKDLSENINNILTKELERANKMLNNEKFISNADPKVIQDEKDKVKFYEDSKEMLNEI